MVSWCKARGSGFSRVAGRLAVCVLTGFRWFRRVRCRWAYGLLVLRAPLILTAAVFLLAGCGSTTAPKPVATREPTKTATPTSSEIRTQLQGRLLKDLARWLTANSPAGVTANLYEVTCEDIGQRQFKCGARGELRDAGGGSEAGHMTLLVTTKPDGSYSSEMTEPWTGGEF